jgi:DNA repair protein SbcC/Rad50
MKILNLYFKNINSLEGETRIDFDRAPISDAGVFAITGPNGSGKSSILDAITLGLYGETYRFDKPAEHVMTKHTQESFARVEFALGEEKFRSSWRVAINPDSAEGALMPSEMTLSRLNGEEVMLEQNPVQVRHRIAELTGMDFHKFSKSMVLAQGDFAAFLNALDNERMDILEKIIGGDIYQDYRDQAVQKLQQVKNDLQQTEAELVATPVMEPAAIESAQQDLQDFSEQATEYRETLSELDEQLNRIKQVVELEQKLDAKQQIQKTVQADKEKHEALLTRIVEVQPAQGFKEEVDALDQATGLVAQSEQTLSGFHNEVAMLQRQLEAGHATQDTVASERTFSEQKAVVDELKLQISGLKQNLPQENALLQSVSQQLAEKQNALSTVEQWLKENPGDKVLLESFPETGKLRSLRVELAELKNKQKKHSQWTKSTTTALKKNKAGSKRVAKQLKLLQRKLAADEQTIKDRTHGKSFEELEELRAEQLERVSDFTELFELAKVNNKIGKKSLFSIFKRSKHDLEVEEHELINEQNTLQLEIGKEENIRKSLEKAVTNEALLKKMQADRNKLEDGKPCPLCGALKHPYVSRPPVISDSKKALADQRGKILALRSHSDSLALQIKELQKKEREDSDKTVRLEQVRSQWRTLCNRLNSVNPRMDIDNFSLMKKLLKTEKQQLKEINSLIGRCSKLHDTIEKTKVNIANSTSLLEELKSENESLDAEWDNRPRELIELEKAYEQCKADESTLAEKVSKQLEALGEVMPAKGQEDSLFDRLNMRRKEYQTRIMRQKVLTEEIVSLQEKVTICQEDVDALNHKLEERSSILKGEEMIGLHLALVEKQKLIVDKEQQLVAEQAQANTVQQALQSKLVGSQFNSIEELKESLALLANQQTVEQELQQLNEQLVTLKNEIVELQKVLQQEQALLAGAEPEQALLDQQQQLQEKLNIVELEISTLQNQLSRQDAMQEKAGRLQQQLAEQQAQLEDCEAEMKLVTDENALPFRRKVQQEMVDRLLSQTNKVLEKISGRYYVRNEATADGFALRIEDTKQGNVHRLPKTLSGGESFVVSLALALALAESASNGHALDSLFIDEGFGYLDAEALYLVMSTLESLPTHGKTVGIISHIEAVQKRVKTQIEMVKKPNGLSALKLAS